jgi:hypothetical protein
MPDSTMSFSRTTRAALVQWLVFDAQPPFQCGTHQKVLGQHRQNLLIAALMAS